MFDEVFIDDEGVVYGPLGLVLRGYVEEQPRVQEDKKMKIQSY